MVVEVELLQLVINGDSGSFGVPLDDARVDVVPHFDCEWASSEVLVAVVLEDSRILVERFEILVDEILLEGCGL